MILFNDPGGVVGIGSPLVGTTTSGDQIVVTGTHHVAIFEVGRSTVRRQAYSVGCNGNIRRADGVADHLSAWLYLPLSPLLRVPQFFASGPLPWVTASTR